MARAATLLSTLLLALAVPAGPAYAAQCSFDADTHTLTILNEDLDGVKIENAAGDLEVNDAVCATIADLDTVIVDLAEMGSLELRLDGGPLGPGFTHEGDGSSELEFDVTGVGEDSAVRATGSASPDGFSAGQRTAVDGVLRELNLNALAEVGSEDVDVTIHGEPTGVSFRGEGDDDELIGTGTQTEGSTPYASALFFDDGEGSDLLVGGDGPDTVIVDLQDDGADTAAGGPGHDLVGVFALEGQDNDVTLDDMNNDGTSCFLGLCDDDNIASDFEEVAGFSADDRIVGGPGDQVLYGANGNDQLLGGPGDDELLGDADDDLLSGGDGDDVLWDAAGADVYLGGAGLDTVDFSRRFFGVAVTMDGVANEGGEGDNVDTDVERLIGTTRTDQFEGGPGRQILIGGGDLDILVGGEGDDVLRGGSGDDVMFGEEGADALDGGDGKDHLNGGLGADRLVGGPGPDGFYGGAGVDVVSYAASTAAVRVSIDGRLNDGAVGEHDGVGATVERVIGSRFADRLLGHAGPNVFRGGAGGDVLRGFGGNDRLYGGAGNDSFDGGGGRDLCAQGGGTGPRVSCER